MKVLKTTAGYEDKSSHKGESCATCAHYRMSQSCSMVAGHIEPGGHSDYYEPSKRPSRQAA